MKLVIYVNDTFEDEQALVDLETGEILLSGDYYHDKIPYQIEGYLYALKEHNIYNHATPEEYIKPSHKYFDQCDFYNGEKEDEDEY